MTALAIILAASVLATIVIGRWLRVLCEGQETDDFERWTRGRRE